MYVPTFTHRTIRTVGTVPGIYSYVPIGTSTYHTLARINRYLIKVLKIAPLETWREVPFNRWKKFSIIAGDWLEQKGDNIPKFGMKKKKKNTYLPTYMKTEEK